MDPRKCISFPPSSLSFLVSSRKWKKVSTTGDGGGGLVASVVDLISFILFFPFQYVPPECESKKPSSLHFISLHTERSRRPKKPPENAVAHADLS